MLFGREYMPEGAGVSPDAPRKKGAARLWETLSRDLDGIFLSGALAMLACAPAAILAGIALWLGSLPLCLLAAAATGWLVGPALTSACTIPSSVPCGMSRASGSIPTNGYGNRTSKAALCPAQCSPCCGRWWPTPPLCCPR